MHPVRLLQESKLYGTIRIEQHKTTIICTDTWLVLSAAIGLNLPLSLNCYLRSMFHAIMTIWAPDKRTAWSIHNIKTNSLRGRKSKIQYSHPVCASGHMICNGASI